VCGRPVTRLSDLTVLTWASLARFKVVLSGIVSNFNLKLNRDVTVANGVTGTVTQIRVRSCAAAAVRLPVTRATKDRDPGAT
jgi:hypothetical protein